MKKYAGMKGALLTVFGVASLSLSTAAVAGQESGPYIGASIGSADLNFDSDPIDFDDDDDAYKIFAGYNFGVIPLIDLAVEGSYVDFGEASSAQILNQDVGITGWNLFGVAGFNLGPVGVFGKAGRIWWDSESDVFQSVLDDSGSDSAYGIGVRLQFGSLAVRAEYERFDIDVADVDYISAGLSWTF